MVEGSYDLSATQNNLEVPPIGKLATIANVVTVSIRFDGVTQALRDILRRNATVFNTLANRITNELNHPQRAAAAFSASAFRSSEGIPSARALPPLTLPSRVLRQEIGSSISLVAILATITAHPTAAAGRFSPFGPLGMPIPPFGGRIVYQGSTYVNHPRRGIYVKHLARDVKRACAQTGTLPGTTLS